jgi:hypothetical protein
MVGLENHPALCYVQRNSDGFNVALFYDAAEQAGA